MFKKLLLLSVLLSCVGLLKAQVPDPCPSNSDPPADDCSTACIYCNFNGMMSQTTGYTQGFAPGFCGTIENDQWLGFIAGAASATFTATPNNCTNGDGIQIALYADCSSNPIACNGGSSGGAGNPVSITAALSPGTNYFLLIDGYAGDQCNFSITVAPPAAVQAPPVGPISAIAGPAQVCPGATVTYSVPDVTGAGAYIWTGPPGTLFNGMPTPATITDLDGGSSVQVTFGAQGGQICVQAVNSCFQGNTVCRNVTVAPIPPTTLPPVVICNEDAPYELPWGDYANSNGPYQTTYQSYQGCDSIVKINVTIKPAIIVNLPQQVICSGASITVCNEQYFDGGNYSYICESFQGCDSLINFQLTVLDPIADILPSGSLSCSSTSVTLNSAPSPAGTTKLWRLLPSGIVVGNGNSITVTTAGTYTLTSSMSFAGVSCTAADTIIVTGNTTAPTLTATNGTIGCGASTTTLTTTTNATNPTYVWSTGATSSSITVNAQGTYIVTVTSNGNGCTATATATVNGNTTPPIANAAGGTLTCSTTSLLLNASSNVPTATYLWSGPGGFTANIPNPSAGQAGTYIVTVTDPGNNCTSTATAIVNLNNTPPGANAGGGTIGCTTPNVTLSGTSPAPNPVFSWAGPNGFTSSAANPSVNQPGTYTLTVTGTNGCTSTATALVDGNTNPPNAAAAAPTLLTCAVTTVPLNGSSSTPGATFAWTGPNGFTSSQQNATANTVGTYTLTVTGPNTCTASSAVTVNGDFATPNASATGGIITCASTSTTIMGNSTTPGATFEWTGPGNFMSNLQNPNASNTGTYTLTVSGPNGCTATATADVMPDANVPNATADGGTMTCLVNSITLNGNSTTPGATLSWVGPNGFISGAPNPTVTVTGIYTLTVLNPINGCTAQATATVDLDDVAPGATASSGTLTCTAPNLALSGSSPANNVSWSWTGPNGFSSALQNPTIMDAGDYTLVVTDLANGCTSSALTTVLADQNAPQASAVVSDVLTCSLNSSTVSASATLPVTYTWSTGATSANIIVSAPGAYTVTATAANGCTTTASATVLQDIAPPNATATGNTIDCNNPQVIIDGASVTTGAGFAWVGPNGFSSPLQSPSVFADGDYTLTVTGPNGCTATATATVDLDTEVPVVAIQIADVLTCSATSIAVDGSAVNGTSPIQTVSWTGPNGFTASLEDISVTEPGPYVLTATAQNGCTSSATATVTQDIVPPLAAAVGGEVTCAITAIPLDGSSTTPGVTYAWTGPNGFSSNLEDPTASDPGPYDLVVTGPNGCTAAAATTVTQDITPPGAAAVSSNNLDCDDLNAALQATSTTFNTAFLWSGPNGFTSDQADVSISDPGPYGVTVTGPNGCTSTASVTVTQDIALPGASALGDTIDCISGVATLLGDSPTGGVSWVWNGPNGLILTDQNPDVSTPGAYILTVTGLNACTSTATADIAQNTDAPVVALSNGGILTCIQTSLTVTGTISTPGATGVWNGPNGFTSGQAAITVTEPGEYTYVVTAVNGCISSPIVNIFEDVDIPEEVVATGGLLNCTFPTVTLNGSSTTPNVTYSWTGPGGFTSNQQNPPVTNPGTYVLTATDPVNGCTSSASSVVTQDPTVPDIAVTAETLNCDVNSVVLDAVTNTPNVDFVWNGPNGFSSTQQSPSVGTAGNYVVTVTAQSGCTATFAITVAEDVAAPGVTAQGVILTCTQPSNSITSNSNTPGVIYAWSGPGGFTSTQQNPTIDQIGTYTVTTTNPANGCTSSATVEVEPDASIPQVQAFGATITCLIASVEINATSNNPTVTYLWSGPGNFTSTDPNPTVDLPGNYTVTVEADNGCTSTTSTTVADNTAEPDIFVGIPDELNCTTTEVTVNVGVQTPGNYTYLWSTQDGSIVSGANQPIATVSQAALYSVLVTDTQNGCTSTEAVPVLTDPATPSGAAVQELGIRCHGETNGAIIIDSVQGGTPPFMYSFDNHAFASSPAFGGLEPGTYALVIQDANGCEFETTVTVDDAEELIVNLGPDTIIHLGQPLTLTVDESVVNQSVDTLITTPADVLLLYCDTCNNPYPTYTFRYQVSAQTARGCRAADERVVIVDKTRYVYIPTAFYPGSGNDNDIFTVFGGEDVVLIKSFRVFDRWGEAVHEYFDFDPTQSRIAGWDGTIRGDLASPAVFVYYAEVLFLDGETVLFKGDVTLVRQ